ncbi:MAG: ABC transporter permease [Acidobacteriota bacterium]|nr:ABC transporter permease [Acidobacteriota bacterium]
MLKTIVIKEWKERLPLVVFSLAALLAFVVLFFVLSGNREAVDILAGAATLAFLPVLGLLLGAGAFQSEFKDGAWAYLFSRPISKSRIWLAKYAAQLGILLAVMGSFTLIIKVVPGIQAVFSDLNWILSFGHNISIFELGCLGAIVLFNAAFSLSILSDKQPSTIVWTLLLWAFLIFGGAQAVLSPLLIWTLIYLNVLSWSLFVLALFSLSLALASILTFSRTDFSQPGKKARYFMKRAAVFLATSFVSCVLLAPVFSPAKAPHFYNMRIAADAAYFRTAKGIFRYDLASSRLRRILKTPLIWHSISVGDGKIIFIKNVPKRRNRMSEELWIMDTSGRNAGRLADTSTEEGPFSNLYIRQAVISPDGRKIALLTRDIQGRERLHGMDGEGRETRSLTLGMPEIPHFSMIVGFSASARYLVIYSRFAKKNEASGTDILRIDLERDADGKDVEILARNIHKAPMVEAFQHDLIAYASIDQDRNQESLILHDIVSNEAQEVLADDSIGLFGFNEARDKLAVWTGPPGHRKLNIYSLTEDRITAQRDGTRYKTGWPLWMSDNLVLLSADSGTGRKSLVLLDESLEEIKTIALPWESGELVNLHCAGKTVFAWEFDKTGLWTLDLESMKWRRIH